MSCHKPLEAYRSPSGAIIFNRHLSLTRISFQLPCGRCIGCRMEKARQWGMRCLHEAKMWPSNHYVTLTYGDEFLPPGGTVCVRDVQLFMKRLRKRCQGVGYAMVNGEWSNPIRFFLGAEYGENNGRPHYHALLFNCSFGDLVPFGRNKRGETLYTSSLLSSLWSSDGSPMGHCTVGAVTFDSAVYCAKYALKKVTGDAAYEAYQVWDENGELYDRVPEFAVMSRRPGIGAPYYEKFGGEVRSLDNVVINGKTVRPPRYYDGKSEIFDAPLLSEHKSDRKRLAVKNKSDNTPERLRVKEKLAIIAAKQKERKL
nr:MAG: replication initiator protein [Microvirus sp.]